MEKNIFFFKLIRNNIFLNGLYDWFRNIIALFLLEPILDKLTRSMKLQVFFNDMVADLLCLRHDRINLLDVSDVVK